MDPANSSFIQEGFEDPPLGAYTVEWFETLTVIVLWDVVRMFAQAWLTKYFIDHRKVDPNKENEKDV